MGTIKYLFEKDEDVLLENTISNKDEWILMTLDEEAEVEVNVGMSRQGFYEIIVSKKFDNWEFRVMDFIGYIGVASINGIVKMNHEDYVVATDTYRGYSYKDKKIRDYESNVLIHSSSNKNWKLIKKELKLKSWKKLYDEGVILTKNPIGKFLGDPDEFSQYVMLGLGTSCEVVVSSSTKNSIDCDIDTIYKPGVRLYLDAEKLAYDSRLIRDGAHVKVMGEVDLSKYLLMAITPQILTNDYEHKWTPKTFSKSADSHFDKYYACDSKHNK